GTALERGVNVPLVMRGPRIRPGARHQLVHVVDFMATLGEALGLCPPADLRTLDLDTRSFAPALADPTFGGRSFVYVDIIPPGPRPRERAAIGPRWKLRRVGVGGGQTETLLDLKADPEEQDPLDPDTHPTISRVLRKVLDYYE
ncbi:MAG: hypothetical protein JRG76_18745, partial [Deltaproteobacteria bacterium]|nr:hypothetical protein [Deltaproteobacteria bacterium]